jgi:hypothetical protein
MAGKMDGKQFSDSRFLALLVVRAVQEQDGRQDRLHGALRPQAETMRSLQSGTNDDHVVTSIFTSITTSIFTFFNLYVDHGVFIFFKLCVDHDD